MMAKCGLFKPIWKNGLTQYCFPSLQTLPNCFLNFTCQGQIRQHETWKPRITASISLKLPTGFQYIGGILHIAKSQTIPFKDFRPTINGFYASIT